MNSYPCSKNLRTTVLAAWLSAALLCSGPAAAADAALAPSHPSLTVTSAAVREQQWAVPLNASGSVAAWMEVSIGARITGLPLTQVLVNVGDRVRKGQLLARFDDSTVRADLEQQQAGLAQALASQEQVEAAAAQAEANRDRALKIQDSGAISEQDVLQYTTAASTARAQVAQAKAQVAQARAAVANAQLRLDFTQVSAPDYGVISARGATVGSVTQAAGAGAELFRLIRQGRLEWRPELTAAQLALVHPGMPASLKLPDGSAVAGKVRQLGASMDSGTRLGLAYVDLQAGSRVLAGMYLSGTLDVAARGALTVPAESVVVRDGRSYLLRLDGQRCHMVLVNVGRRQGLDAEILSGVKAGDQVVVQGAGFLNDNDLVRVVGEPAPR